MSFSSLLKHSVTINRLKATAGVKTTYQLQYANVRCFIQPLDDASVQIVGLAYGKGYKCYMPANTDVREGDQLIDQSGRTFFVRGIKDRDYGNFPHLDVLLNEDKRP